MNWLKRIAAFFKRLGREPHFEPGEVENTEETEIEIERRRGMPGN